MRDLFSLDPDVVFLNHGSYGACPHPVMAALHDWQRQMERNPVEFLGRRSAGLLRTARESLAGFVGASADDLVFVPNATTGVNIVARSLALQAGDEVLGTDLEYGACDATWQFVCHQQGAHYRQVTIPLPLQRETFVERLLAEITPRTRVLYLSHITSTTALILPLQDLMQAARERGVLTLIDGAHAPGQIELDLDALGADFYTGNCHKWMCAPKGTAFLHARAEHQERLDATVVSWGYVAGSAGHTGFDAYTGRSVFERRLQWQGTRDIAGCLSVPAAIEFHREHLAGAARERCHAMALQTLHTQCARSGLESIGRDDDFAQMVPIPVPPCDAEALRSWLFDRHRIEVPVTQHGGRTFVRVSVQAYTTAQDLHRLEAALRERWPDG